MGTGITGDTCLLVRLAQGRVQKAFLSLAERRVAVGQHQTQKALDCEYSLAQKVAIFRADARSVAREIERVDVMWRCPGKPNELAVDGLADPRVFVFRVD